MQGRTYRFAVKEPLYPFGFGLSYVRITFGELVLSETDLREGQELVLRTTLSNEGACDALETAQCYIVPPQNWPGAPRAALVDFTKVEVPAGSTVEVSFRLSSDAFCQFDTEGRRRWAPGTYGIVVGAASPGCRALALGAPEPAVSSVVLARSVASSLAGKSS
jgi:beta-glucosidase